MTNVEIIRINYSVFMAPLFEQATSPIYQFIMSKNDRIRARTIKMRARASVSQGDKWEKRMRCKLSLELIRWLVMALTYLLSLTFCRHRCLSPVVVSFICFFFFPSVVFGFSSPSDVVVYGFFYFFFEQRQRNHKIILHNQKESNNNKQIQKKQSH